jgi:hypothetical protein
MADDEQDFTERTQSANEKLNARPISIDEMADNFALYGLKKRAAMLESFDAELGGDIGSGSDSLRRQARLLTLRRKLGGLHEALRKAER